MTEDRRHTTATQKMTALSKEIGILISILTLGGLLLKATARVTKLEMNANMVPTIFPTLNEHDKRISMLEDDRKNLFAMVNRRFDRLERIVDSRGR